MFYGGQHILYVYVSYVCPEKLHYASICDDIIISMKLLLS